MSSYKELLAQKEKLERELEQARQAEMAGVIERIREAIVAYDLTPGDLFSRVELDPTKGSKLKGSTVAPKYRNPETGQTWSGRGRMPGWLTPGTADQFLIA